MKQYSKSLLTKLTYQVLGAAIEVHKFLGAQDFFGKCLPNAFLLNSGIKSIGIPNWTFQFHYL